MAENEPPSATPENTPLPLYIKEALKRKRAIKAAARDRQKAKEYDWSCGRVGVELGIPAASRVQHASRDKIRYWTKRVIDPLLHNGSLGGARNGFELAKEEAVCSAIKQILDFDPTLSTRAMCSHILELTGHLVSKTYVKDALAAADWTYVTREIN